MKKIEALIKRFKYLSKGLDAFIDWMAQDAGLPPIERKRPDDKGLRPQDATSRDAF